jgi:polar amino acid transport system substrate-binding protein
MASATDRSRHDAIEGCKEMRNVQRNGRTAHARLGIGLFIVAASLGFAACGSDDGGERAAASTTEAEGTDVVADVEESGILRIATDAKYPPSGSLNPSGDYEGYSVDIAKAVAADLGVEPKFISPNFDLVVGGGWNGRWDMSAIETTPTLERQEVIDPSIPYDFNVIRLIVHEDNSEYRQLPDLSGATIGTAAGGTLEDYLKGGITLPEIPYNDKGVRIESQIKDPEIKSYPDENAALNDLALGDGTRLDAVIATQVTLDGAIKQGLPVKGIGAPAWLDPGTLATDNDAEGASLIEAANETITRLSESGELEQIFESWDVSVRSGGLEAYTALLASGSIEGELAEVDYTLAIP